LGRQERPRQPAGDALALGGQHRMAGSGATNQLRLRKLRAGSRMTLPLGFAGHARINC
jgi:hypothetical protein